MIIAIDGPSGTGKSTVALLVSKELGFLYFNSGAMYRSLAFQMLSNQQDIDSDEDIKDAISSFEFDIAFEEDEYRYKLNGQDVSSSLWQDSISEAASFIAKKPFVRKALLPLQKAFGKRGNVVFEGRDIGTIIFPQAEVKIYLTASDEVRARRRFEQLKEKFPDKADSFNFAVVLENVIDRDKRDVTRDIAPLKKADGAFEIDTSMMNIDQVVKKIVDLSQGKR